MAPTTFLLFGSLVINSQIMTWGKRPNTVTFYRLILIDLICSYPHQAQRVSPSSMKLFLTYQTLTNLPRGLQEK